MRSKWICAALAALAVGAAGCSSVPPPTVDAAALDALQPGVATHRQVGELLGLPASESAGADGARVLRWETPRRVVAVFGADKRLQGLVYGTLPAP